MQNIDIEIRSDWVRRPTDCSTCILCKDIIFSDMWVMTLQLQGCKPQEVPDMQVCNSCYDSQNEDEL